MTTQSKIDYESLWQDAMRGVVRAVLTQVVEDGLPGDHHFYISFDTTSEDVNISKRLKAKYPQEMTIVLQHRFWELKVFDDRFEVKLSFDGIPERLVIAYKAIKVFFDPSVRYGLQFEDAGFTSEAIDQSLNGIDLMDQDQIDDSTVTSIDSIAPATQPAKIDLDDGEEHIAAAVDETEAAASDVDTDASTAEDKTNDTGAEIVSLDAFRKK
ncbi:MAG: ClpXP protease specificity-enhancing factor SspB [Pseudomonadota bacterium]